MPNDTRHSLARIPLRWMIRECFRTNSGIQFEADKLRAIAGIDPASLYPIVLPRPPPLEIHKELAASLSLMNYAKSGKMSEREKKALADSAKLLEEKLVDRQEKEQVKKRTDSIQKLLVRHLNLGRRSATVTLTSTPPRAHRLRSMVETLMSKTRAPDLIRS